MSARRISPCPLCGYDAPILPCRVCGGTPREPSLAAAPPPHGAGFVEGLRALPMGVRMLLSTRRTKRWLVPPLLATLVAFGAVFAWTWSHVSDFFDAVRAHSADALGLDAGWVRDAVEWVLGFHAVIALAHAGTFVAFLVLGGFVSLWMFSIAYAALCGPFLDVIQGRIEARWFGVEPKSFLLPPLTITTRTALATLAASSVASLALFVGWIAWSSGWAWLLLLATPLPFVVAARLVAGFGPWLAQNVGAEIATLWVSVKASLFAGIVLLLFFWVKFLPFVGWPLFAMLAGFTTSIAMLDVAFARRRFSLSQRLRVVFGNLPAVVALGIVTSFLFVVPFFGPLVAVPGASIGGDWLLCRLDKSRLRPRP